MNKFFDSSVKGILIGSVLCGAYTFIKALTGYGSYLRSELFLIYPACVGVTFIFFFIGVLKDIHNLSVLALPIDGKDRKWLKYFIVPILPAFIFSIAMIAGKYPRKYIRFDLVKKSHLVIAALDDYYAKHRHYPKTFKELPKWKTMPLITFQNGYLPNSTDEIYPSKLNDVDMTCYLNSKNYLCLIPIERAFFDTLNFNRIYVKSSEDKTWHEEKLRWRLVASRSS